MTRGPAPIGYFVHHQGRGHAERALDLAGHLAKERPVTLFCARPDMLSGARGAIDVVELPSLFEPRGDEDAGLSNVPTPSTLHCAPVGWPAIGEAVAAITAWFARERPALFVTDVSAELGQLARIASVPHCAVLQHGLRGDPGHRASYDGALCLLAPYAETLEEPDRPAFLRDKTIYAPGVGVDVSNIPSREDARSALQISAEEELVVVVGGGGGNGLPTAPITLGARARPASRWVTLGKMQHEWHETPPGNLHHMGWVDNPEFWIAAADRVVSSAGNTTVHVIASIGRPWIVVPEWRYFSEQICKAEALDRAGIAAMARHWPSCQEEWDRSWRAADAIDIDAQRSIYNPEAGATAAAEIEQAIARHGHGPAFAAGQQARLKVVS